MMVAIAENIGMLLTQAVKLNQTKYSLAQTSQLTLM